MLNPKKKIKSRQKRELKRTENKTLNISNMKTHYLTVTVNIKVKSNLSIEDIIDQFGSETDYNFSSTDEVEVIETEILEVD